MKHLLKAYGLLDAKERRQAWMIVGFVTVMALFDTLGAVSIMPFLAVLANPGMIETNTTLAWLNARLGGVEPQAFLFFLGCGSFALLVLSATVRGTGAFVVNRFAMMRGFTIGSRLMDTYLRQPYAYYLNRHTGDMAKETVILEVTEADDSAQRLKVNGFLTVDGRVIYQMIDFTLE